LTLACVACASSGGAVDFGDAEIDGAVGGRTFTRAAASYRIGEADDPDRTIVVYVFDAEIGCEELSSPGWDARIGDDVQALEMKTIGTEPGEYAVVGGAMLGSGDASVNYTLASTSATPQEISATSGHVTLTAVGDGAAEGEFDLVFPDGSTLAGSFGAAPCEKGHEP